MLGFSKRKSGKRQSLFPLGHLEFCIMEAIWQHGESSVRDVVRKLDRQLAYTTVMTTLDRLYKKGLLSRQKAERAFLYAPTLSRDEWEHKQAGDWLGAFLSDRQSSGELLVSCFVETLGKHDEKLLAELERKIELKRKELSEGRKP